MALLAENITKANKNIRITLDNRTIILFITKALLIFLSLIFSYSILGKYYSDLLIISGNSYFKANINYDNKLARSVNIEKQENSDEVLLKTTFKDKFDDKANPIMKVIKINLRRECWLPFAILLSLILATPFIIIKKSFFYSIISLVVINLYVLFKLFIFTYDNYNMPEYTLKKLPLIVSGIVYYGNYFFNLTGSSTNVIFPLLIWIILVSFQFFKTKIAIQQ